jgi:predicted GIY-YIG superfamily endonuclease
MPQKPIDYSKTIIYKIVCNDLNVVGCYMGHTTDLTQRKSNHKKTCVYEKGKSYNYKVYTTIRNNGGWDNYNMV